MKEFFERGRKRMKELKESLVENTASGIRGATEKVTRPITDMKYIRRRQEAIERLLARANGRIGPERAAINGRLELLGEVELRILSTTLAEFTALMDSIAELPFGEPGGLTLTRAAFEQLRTAASSAGALLEGDAAGDELLSASALFGTVALLGSASESGAADALSAAAANPTLLWLRDGTLKSEGTGRAVMGGIALVPSVSSLIRERRFSLDEERETIDRCYREAVGFARNSGKIIEQFRVLERFIENATALIERYNTASIQLNKQTINIIAAAGSDYRRYSREQQQLIRRHAEYAYGLVTLLETPLMKEEGTLNDAAVQTIAAANDFLNRSGPVHFRDFKKRRFLWEWLLVAAVLSGALAAAAYLWLQP